MNDRPPTTQNRFAPRRQGFGVNLLDALHESRRRQAAREIHSYRHLIDAANAYAVWRAIARSHAMAPRRKLSAASGTPARSSWLAILTSRMDASRPPPHFTRARRSAFAGPARGRTIIMNTKLLLREADAERPWDAGQSQPRSHAGRMSLETKLVIAAVLVGFAILHAVGGTLLMRHSAGPPAETGAFMHRGD
jgi:hypothetical protein